MRQNARGKPLDPEWLRWLRENVARGCAIEELRGILLSNGFDAIAVEAAIATAPRGAAPPMPSVPAGEIPKPRMALPGAVQLGAGKADLYVADDFLSAEECEAIVSRVLAQLRPSTITSPPGAGYDSTFRTSRTCDLSDSDPAVASLDAKIYAAIGFDKSLAEPTQGQHYEVGQVFKTHTDFFKPYELDKHTMGALGQRTWTFMIYLNTPKSGGETEFPTLGMKVTPKRGRAVVWNNLRDTGDGNDATRHQSLPVTGGTKTIITKWFRMPKVKP